MATRPNSSDLAQPVNSGRRQKSNQHYLSLSHIQVNIDILTMAKKNSSSSSSSSRGGGGRAPSAAPLIKGYLPVRLKVPKPPQLCRMDEDSCTTTATDDTYFYVREHQGKTAATTSAATAQPTASAAGCTLFIANAPFIPGISTKILLRSLLGRFADVTRVTVVPSPRGDGHGDGGSTTNTSSIPSTIANTTSMGYKYGDSIIEGHISSTSSLLSSFGGCWSDAVDQPSFLPPVLSEGKYAHVVFATPKELKKAISALEELMSGHVDASGNVIIPGSGKKKRKHKHKKHNHHDNENNSNEQQSEVGGGGYGDISSHPALTLDSIEIQTLSDESWRQWEENKRKKKSIISGNHESDDDADNDNDEGKRQHVVKNSGITAIAQRYRDSCSLLTRERLLEECNAVMQAYEDAEEEKRRARAASKAQPDDDGFITVSYSDGVVGSKSELEQSATATTPSRRKGNKRTRKKKDAVGAQQLDDFYRFQRKENRKRSMDELRKKFQADLQKVKRLKEERQYRPF
jgi:ribosomal RNA-processing protein 7